MVTTRSSSAPWRSLAAAFAGGVLAAVPAIHPEIPGRLPEPGPFFAHQGPGAVAVLIATHVLYGAVVGAVYGAGRRPAGPPWTVR